MIRRPPRSTHCISSAASDVYKRQEPICLERRLRLHEALYKWLTCTYILPQSGRSRYECDHMRRRRVCRTEWLEFCTSSSETLVHVSHGRAYDGNPLCQQGGLPSIESRGDTCLGRCCVDLHKAKRSPCGRINKGACGAHPLHQQEPVSYTHLTLPTICSV